jgi:hypothetical protein
MQEHMMPTTKEEPLSGKDSLAIMSSADAASEILGLRNYEEPQIIQEAIERFLEELATGKTRNKLGASKGAMALGSLWGNTLLMAYDWKWTKVVHGEWTALGLVDAEKKYLALPHQMFTQLLSDSRDPSMAGPYSRFKAVGANHLPEAAAGSYTIITS